MKKIKNTGFIILLALMATFEAQVLNASSLTVYASDGFERKGVTEFLAFTDGFSVGYWTSVKQREVSLVVDTFYHTRRGFVYEVRFPRSTVKYKLLQSQKNKVICVHPNGRRQVFTKLPNIYVSKNFKQSGVTEYFRLGEDRRSFYYFTSQNKQKQIKLIEVSSKPAQGFVRWFRFPNSSLVYGLEVEPCPCGVILIHANGQRQRFARFYWKTLNY